MQTVGVEQHGSANMVENVRAMPTINNNEEPIELSLAVLIAPD